MNETYEIDVLTHHPTLVVIGTSPTNASRARAA